MDILQDPVIAVIKDEIIKSPICQWVEKVYLFGSRARGDNNQRSDYDVAFDINPSCSDSSRIDDLFTKIFWNNPSLKQLDLVNLSKASKSIQDMVTKEGKVIYVKTSKP